MLWSASFRRQPRNWLETDALAEGTLLCRSPRLPLATDASLEKEGFEPVWGFSCQVVVFWFVAGSLFGAGKPFFVPSPAIRFAERAEGVKGPKR